MLGFGSPRWATGSLDLMLVGPVGSNYEIDASTDLFNWLRVTSFASTNSPSYFSDPAASSYKQRFLLGDSITVGRRVFGARAKLELVRFPDKCDGPLPAVLSGGSAVRRC